MFLFRHHGGSCRGWFRTYDLNAPFPEEFNRRLTGLISNIHYVTKISENNLIKEGVDKDKIHVTGNTVIDSLFWVLNKIDSNPEVRTNVNKLLNEHLLFDWKHSKYILITAHRREFWRWFYKYM